MQLAPDIQWQHSYVAEGKTFCIYPANNEDVIYKHSEISGFPATQVTEIKRIFGPTTANDSLSEHGVAFLNDDAWVHLKDQYFTGYVAR